MTDTPASRPTDELADLKAAVDAIAARLDRVEAQAPRPGSGASPDRRLAAAWAALRGRPDAPTPPDATASDAVAADAGPGRFFWQAVTLCLALLALILAVELVDDLFDGLWHIGRWID